MSPKEDMISELTREIERLEKEGPSSNLSSAYHTRAEIFYQEENFSGAVADYDKMIALGKGFHWPYDESNLREEIAKCYAYSSFAKCQQGDWSRAFFDFERAFQDAPNIVDNCSIYRIFSELLKDNPQSIVALILSTLSFYGPTAYGPVAEISVEEILREIKTDPQTAHNLLKHWGPTVRHYEQAKLLNALAIYESGDVPGALQAVKDIFLIGADSQESFDEVESNIFYPLFSLTAENIPVGNFGLAYLYCQKGDVLQALMFYGGMPEDYSNQPLVQEGINEALQLAPQAIEMHIERKEFNAAAYLAERLGDFARAGGWHEITAEGLEEEKGDKESVAAIYQQAAECFSNVGDEARARSCWGNVHRLREQAKLKVVIDAPENLVVGEWDALSITVANTGFGPAENLSAKVEGPVTMHDMSESNAIAAGERRMIEIAVRPNEPGRRVPITVQIVYRDSTGERALPPITKLIPVSASEAP